MILLRLATNQKLLGAMHRHGEWSLQSAPLSLQGYISIIVDYLASVPFASLALLGPHYIFFHGVAALLPLLHLLILEPCSA